MPTLQGQTVVVIGGSAGIGLETARLARSEGADVVITGRDPDRLRQAAGEVGALVPPRSTPPIPYAWRVSSPIFPARSTRCS